MTLPVELRQWLEDCPLGWPGGNLADAYNLTFRWDGTASQEVHRYGSGVDSAARTEITEDVNRIATRLGVMAQDVVGGVEGDRLRQRADEIAASTRARLATESVLTGGRLRNVAFVQGAPLPFVPPRALSINLPKDDPPTGGPSGGGSWSSIAANNVALAKSRGSDTLIVAVPLATGVATSKRGQGAASLAALETMASGIYDDELRATARTFRDSGLRCILRLGWECNLPWTPWYCGVQLIDGVLVDRGPTFRATWEHVATIVKSEAPQVACVLCWAHPSAEFDADDPDNPSKHWNPTAVPHMLPDAVEMDLYGRSEGRSLDEVDRRVSEHLAFAGRLGVPPAVGEYGVTLPLLDGETRNWSLIMRSDEQAAAHIDHVLSLYSAVPCAYFGLFQASGKEAEQGYRYRLYPQSDPMSWQVLRHHLEV